MEWKTLVSAEDVLVVNSTLSEYTKIQVTTKNYANLYLVKDSQYMVVTEGHSDLLLARYVFWASSLTMMKRIFLRNKEFNDAVTPPPPDELLVDKMLIKYGQYESYNDGNKKELKAREAYFHVGMECLSFSFENLMYYFRKSSDQLSEPVFAIRIDLGHFKRRGLIYG